jgi:hypothetical protein
VHYALKELSAERQSGYDWERRFPEVILAIRLVEALRQGGATAVRQTRELHAAELANEERIIALAKLPEVLAAGGQGLSIEETGLSSTRKFVAGCSTLLTALASRRVSPQKR